MDLTYLWSFLKLKISTYLENDFFADLSKSASYGKNFFQRHVQVSRSPWVNQLS